MKSVKYLAIGIFFVFLIASVSAIEITDFSCKNVENYKDMAIGKNLPESAPFTNEVLNIYVSNETYGNLVIEEKIIIDFSCIENENATYNVYIKDSSVIKDFAESDDIIETYKNSTESGDLEIKGVGFGKKIKLAFVKFFLKFA